MAQPLFTNFAMDKVREEEQPFTNAVLTIAWTAGWGASANVGGALIEHYSYSVPFFVISVLYLIATVVVFSLFKNEKTL
jgi:predicted MFS family arabinose efflux permease